MGDLSLTQLFLLLQVAPPPSRWEDEDKVTNDVEALREEFRRRLYAKEE